MPIYENPFSMSNPSQMTASGGFSLNQRVVQLTGITPAMMSVVHNPVVWGFSSSAITSNEVYSAIRIDILSVPDNGEYLLISGSSVSDFPAIQLVCKAKPGPGEIYSNSTSPLKSINDLAACIASVLNSDFNFSLRFFCVAVSNSVYIQARESGKRYNMNYFSSDFDLQLVSTTGATDTNIAQQYKDWSFYGDVYVDVDNKSFYSTFPSRNLFEKVATVEIDYQPSNEYTIDVQRFLEPYVKHSIPLKGSGVINLDSGATSSHYIVYGERYDEFRNNFRRSFPIGQTQVRWQFNSSLDFLSANTVTNRIASNSIASPQSVKFLTNAPRLKMTYLDGIEYLCYLAEGGASRLHRIKGQFELWNGSVSGYTAKFTTVVNKGGFRYVDVSPSLMGIPTSLGVRRYTAQVFANDNEIPTTDQQVSELFTFEIMPDCVKQESASFIWLNELGGWDSFVFNGEFEKEIKRKTSSFGTNPPLISGDRTKRLISDFDINLQETRTSFTQWLDTVHFEWLSSIANSDEVRIWDGSAYIPVVITGMDYQRSTLDDVYQVKIEWALAKNTNKNSNQ